VVIQILGAASRLDAALGQRFGRPYHALLGAGLVIEIGGHIHELIDVPDAAAGLVRGVLAIVLYAALLIHQLGELYERTWRRRKDWREE
jgi:hypothetical protein